jgi:hypothetical protein
MLGIQYYFSPNSSIHLFHIIEVKNIMNSIAEESFIKPRHSISMEEYDDQVFRTQTKS